MEDLNGEKHVAISLLSSLFSTVIINARLSQVSYKNAQKSSLSRFSMSTFRLRHLALGPLLLSQMVYLKERIGGT